jgi:hypothetical protein
MKIISIIFLALLAILNLYLFTAVGGDHGAIGYACFIATQAILCIPLGMLVGEVAISKKSN